MWGFVAIAVLFLLAAGRKEAVAAAVTRKGGVTGAIRPEMLPAVAAVQNAWRRHGLAPPVLTSIEDGEHSQGSLHYVGLAHDYRLNTIRPDLHEVLSDAVAEELGNDFDVVHEFHNETRDHLHVEFDP